MHTADGAPQAVLGYIDTEVVFQNVAKPFRLYVVPSLSQPLYLGIDFWKVFGLAPVMCNEVSLPSSVDENVHVLSSSEQSLLDIVKQQFPSFVAQGLGQTQLLTHKIDVGSANPIKQRHYPVSPAIQKLMYDEVDRMVELGVVEESQSSSNTRLPLCHKN